LKRFLGRKIEGSKVGNKAITLGRKFLDLKQSNKFFGKHKIGNTTHTHFFLLTFIKSFTTSC
jgi:hypothetical protein